MLLLFEEGLLSSLWNGIHICSALSTFSVFIIFPQIIFCVQKRGVGGNCLQECLFNFIKPFWKYCFINVSFIDLSKINRFDSFTCQIFEGFFILTIIVPRMNISKKCFVWITTQFSFFIDYWFQEFFKIF